jgi:hypothetical protein
MLYKALEPVLEIAPKEGTRNVDKKEGDLPPNLR